MEEPTDNWDLFISHAYEDKAAIARPLAEELQRRGFRVWYDEFSLTLGDSLRRSIDKGLANSRFAVVVLSRNFFAKSWTQIELGGLTSREASAGKVILPVWHEISAEEVARHSPILADRLAITSERGVVALADSIEAVVRGRLGRPEKPGGAVGASYARVKPISAAATPRQGSAASAATIPAARTPVTTTFSNRLEMFADRVLTAHPGLESVLQRVWWVYSTLVPVPAGFLCIRGLMYATTRGIETVDRAGTMIAWPVHLVLLLIAAGLGGALTGRIAGFLDSERHRWVLAVLFFLTSNPWVMDPPAGTPSWYGWVSVVAASILVAGDG